MNTYTLPRLEDHLVWLLVAPQAEACTQIRLEIGHLLDVRHERLVHLLLVLYPLRFRVFLLGCCFALLEEVVLALAVLLLACPVFVLADTLYDFIIHTRDIDDGGGSNHVTVVYSAERDAIGLERAGDEKNALGELAHEYDALAAESTGEEDQDCAGCERVAVFGGVGGLAGLQLSLSLLINVVSLNLAKRRGKKLMTCFLLNKNIPSSVAAPLPQHSTLMLSAQP